MAYKVVTEALLEGASVNLEDQYGGLWEGFMTGDSRFSVTQPLGDPRKLIAVSNMMDSSAFVEAIADCVSFRCCSTAQGTVAGESCKKYPK